MPVTLNDDECYRLFVSLDTYARICSGKNEVVNAWRERFLPFYRDWHATNPHKAYPYANGQYAERTDE